MDLRICAPIGTYVTCSSFQCFLHSCDCTSLTIDLRYSALSDCLRVWCRCIVSPVCARNAIRLSISTSSSIGCMYIISWTDELSANVLFCHALVCSLLLTILLVRLMALHIWIAVVHKWVWLPPLHLYTFHIICLVFHVHCACVVCSISEAAMGGSFIVAYIVLLWLSLCGDLGSPTSSSSKVTLGLSLISPLGHRPALCCHSDCIIGMADLPCRVLKRLSTWT